MPAKGSSLESWLLYIASVNPREIELGLERTRVVARRMGIEKPAALVVTVAGTNGKGSCVASMEAILQQAGYKTGSYTSPHILLFNERIRVDAACLDDQSLVTAFEAVEAARCGETLSYFEFATLAALYLFKQSQVDVALLEVGLGGRLDAVNIVDADVAIISSIAIDHSDWLGSDIETIAAEKAGIIRPGITVLYGAQQPPMAIFHKAAELQATLLLWSIDFQGETDATQGKWCWRGRNRAGDALQWPDLPLPKLMLSNVATAIQALLLLPLSIDRGDVAGALKHLHLSARFEHRRDLRSGRSVIVDVAHNPAAMQQLARQLQRRKQSEQGRGRVALVLAVMADKDVRGMLTALESCVDIWYIAQVDLARSMAADEVAQAMKDLGIVCEAGCVSQYDSAEKAYLAACEQLSAEDTVLVTGSFYTVAAVYARSEAV